MSNLLAFAPIINTLIIVFIVIFILRKSHSWTGPAIENRVGKIEATLKILVGNFGRLERDFDLFRQEVSKTDDEMLSEMKSIGTVGHEFNLLRERFTQIEDGFLKIDQLTTSLPCNPCRGEVKK